MHSCRPAELNDRPGREAIELSRFDTATTKADDEATPPLTAGPAWTPTWIEWLSSFHGDRCTGLESPDREATWAVTADQRVIGSACLRRKVPHVGDGSLAGPAAGVLASVAAMDAALHLSGMEEGPGRLQDAPSGGVDELLRSDRPRLLRRLVTQRR